MKKKASKLAVFLPILLGVMIALVLMVIGDIEDAPGLYAIGLLGGYILILFGVNKTGVIKKGLFTPILMLSFAVFITLLVAVTLIDGEFGANPEYSAFFFISAAALAIVGVLGLRKARKSNKQTASAVEQAPAEEAPAVPAEAQEAPAEEAPTAEEAPAEAEKAPAEAKE